MSDEVKAVGLRECPLCESAVDHLPDSWGDVAVYCTNQKCGCTVFRDSAREAFDVWNRRPTLDAAIAAAEARGRREGLSELRALYRAYIHLLESGRDRIIGLGGDCDPVDRMEQGDPALIQARAMIGSLADAAPRGRDGDG